MYLQYDIFYYMVIKLVKSKLLQFQLACQEWKRTLVGLVHISGYTVGVIIVGSLSDRYTERRDSVLEIRLFIILKKPLVLVEDKSVIKSHNTYTHFFISG